MPEHLLDSLIPILFVIIWLVSSVIQATRKKGKEVKRGQPVAQYDPLEELFGEELRDEMRRRAAEQNEVIRAEQMLDQSQSVKPVFRKEKKGRDYVSELHREQQRLKEAQLYAKKILPPPVVSLNPYSIGSGKTIKHSAVVALRHKRSVQRAFITYEVLANPLGLREDGQIGRSWEN